MQPNYRTVETRSGTGYIGESLPLGLHMVRQAQLNKSNRFVSLMDEHAALRKKQRLGFYSDLALLLGGLILLVAGLAFLLHRRKR